MSSSTIPAQRLITLSLVACVVAVAAAFFVTVMTSEPGTPDAIVDDPEHYSAISEAIVGGAVPYVDFPVEHLPGAVVPMLVTEFVTRVVPVHYVTAWALLMTISFVLTTALWRRVPLDFDAGWRFLCLSAFLLPVVLFRVEPWLMLLVAVSLVLSFERKAVASSVFAVLAVWTKAWPLVLFAIPYRLGKRRVAVVGAAVSSIPVLWVSMQSGFREGRAFDGIHTETVVGNILLVVRHITGEEPGVVASAGAAYATADTWAVLANAAIGLVFLAFAAYGISRTRSLPDLLAPVGLVVFAIMIGSPLFSAQFVFWLVPFVVFLRWNERQTFIAASALTTLSVAMWAPLQSYWAVVVLTRNLLLLALGVMWILAVASAGRSAGIVPSASQTEGSEQVA
jgi:hypothetical protein